MRIRSSTRKKRNQGVVDIIVVADKKRVTLDSLEAWYQSQERYQKVMQKTWGLKRELEKMDDSEREALLSPQRSSFTVGKRIRIRRAALEWWLSPQDTAFGKEDC